MGTKCDGCDSAIYDILFMECSQEKCKKVYHLQCLSLPKERFEELSVDFKNTWICPACKCNTPKLGNTETPVRGTVLNKTFTPGYFVNTQPRGARQIEETMIEDNNVEVLRVLRELRLEMKNQQEAQVNNILKLQEQLNIIQVEIKDIRKNMSVMEENTRKLDRIEKLLKTNAHQEGLQSTLQENTSINTENLVPLTFANVTKQRKAEVVTPSSPTMECRATKPAKVRVEPSANAEEIELNNEGDWKTVNRTRKKYPKGEVKKGGCTNSVEIQGSERKKFLHVWRVMKDTSVESMEAFVKKICGETAEIKVTSIRHKTERDYASFIIAVPEKMYETLCEPEHWPVNIEYCEWVWFRRDNPKSDDQKQQ